MVVSAEMFDANEHSDTAVQERVIVCIDVGCFNLDISETEYVCEDGTEISSKICAALNNFLGKCIDGFTCTVFMCFLDGNLCSKCSNAIIEFNFERMMLMMMGMLKMFEPSVVTNLILTV